MKKTISILLSLVMLLSVSVNSCITANAQECNHNYITDIKKTTPQSSGYVDHVCSKCGDEHYKYLEKIKVRLSKKVYTYTGKVIKPKIKANYSSDCYKVIYPKGMKKPGKYTVKIVFDDQYHSGTVTKDFWIVKKPSKVKGLSSRIKINNKKYTVTYVAKWKKVKGADGYQLRTGGNDGGGNTWAKPVTVKGASKTSYKINLSYGSGEAGDYFSFAKVRAYKIVGGKKIYGKWSKVVYSKTNTIG